MAVHGSIHVAPGVSLPYRLDGDDEQAPVLMLSNSALTDWTMWDDFLSAFLARPENKHYRVLQYNNRGRAKHAKGQKLTLDILTDDVVTILNRLNVAKAALFVGISLGGLTAIKLAKRYANRVDIIIPCDFGPASPPNNAEIWNSRVEIAKNDERAPVDAEGDRLVGEDLADATIERWLSQRSLACGLSGPKLRSIRTMVCNNRLDGFVDITQALASYDVRLDVERAKTPALFIAGAEDTPVIEPMRAMAKSYRHLQKISSFAKDMSPWHRRFVPLGLPRKFV